MAKSKISRGKSKSESLIKVVRSMPTCEQVKVFRCQSSCDIEGKVNEWLKENIGRIDIISREFVQEELGFRVVIWFRK